MTERDFLYWLNGYLELSGAKSLDEFQLQILKDHLKLVMTKVTPTVNIPTVFPQTILPQTKNPLDFNKIEVIC